MTIPYNLQEAGKRSNCSPSTDSTTWTQASGRARTEITANQENIARLEAKLHQKNEVIAELMKENARARKANGSTLTGHGVPHDTRDKVINCVRRWHERTELSFKRFVCWLGIRSSTFHDCQKRYGKANEHNACIGIGDWPA